MRRWRNHRHGTPCLQFELLWSTHSITQGRSDSWETKRHDPISSEIDVYESPNWGYLSHKRLGANDAEIRRYEAKETRNKKSRSNHIHCDFWLLFLFRITFWLKMKLLFWIEVTVEYGWVFYYKMETGNLWNLNNWSVVYNRWSGRMRGTVMRSLAFLS